MILADTSVWIDFLRQTNTSVEKRMIVHLEEDDLITVSAVFGELLQGTKNEKENKTILDYWINVPKLEEDDLFIEAGKLSARYKLFKEGVGLIECYILAGAVAYGHELWTLDKNLLHAFKKIS